MLSTRTLLASGQLVLLAIAAFLSANVVNTLVAGRYRSRPAIVADTQPVETAPAAKRALAYYSVITDRDIFNPPRANEPTATAPVSELKAKLLGTAPGAGIDSYAIIEDDAQKSQQLYRIGDTLQERTLIKVDWDHVTFKGPRGEEVLQLVEATNKTPPAAAAAPATGGIQQRSDTDYVIDRAEVDRQMENMNQLFTQVRAVPHFQDGKAAGFRLFAIRQDSVFEKIGLKNGDVVTRVNGNDLTDPARAMSLIQELRNEGRITVDVVRNRQPTTLSYEIR
jgi:general secretion pathway protein C